MLKRALDRLRGTRHIEWLLMLIVLAAAVLLTTGTDFQGAAPATEIERRMEAVLSCVEGAGQVRVLVNSPESMPAFSQGEMKTTGVIVVAEGAGDMKVRLALQQAVRAFLGVDTGQIEILTMREDGS